MIWASPEALALMHDIRLQDRFADHSTLSIGLRLQAHIPRLLHWPKPRHIPWHLVKDSWDPPSPATPSTPASTTARFAHLWSTIEGSLQGHIQRPECPSLTAQEQGRGQRTAPMPARPHMDFLRPHRPGEVALRNDLAGDSCPTMVPPATATPELQPCHPGRLNYGHGHPPPSRTMGRHQSSKRFRTQLADLVGPTQTTRLGHRSLHLAIGPAHCAPTSPHFPGFSAQLPALRGLAPSSALTKPPGQTRPDPPVLAPRA